MPTRLALGRGNPETVLRGRRPHGEGGEKLDDLQNKVLIQDAVDEEKGSWLPRFRAAVQGRVKQIAELGVKHIKVVDTTHDDGIIIKCMKKDPAKNEEEALKDIYRRLRL